MLRPRFDLIYLRSCVTGYRRMKSSFNSSLEVVKVSRAPQTRQMLLQTGRWRTSAASTTTSRSLSSCSKDIGQKAAAGTLDQAAS